MSTDPIRVLLIEDDPDDVLLLKEAVSEAKVVKIKLAHAGSLAEGLKRAADQAFDAILLDLNLPDSRGLDTLSSLLRQALTTPVVVLSGLADEATALEAVKLGAQDYLVKGDIGGSTVTRVLRYAIERQRAEEQVRQRAEELALINALNLAVNRGEEIEQIIELFSLEIRRLFGCPAAITALPSSEKKHLILQKLDVSSELMSRIEKLLGTNIAALPLKIPMTGEGYFARVMQTGTSLVIHDAASIKAILTEFTDNPLLKPLASPAYDILGIHSVMLVPLIAEGEILGVVGLARAERFTETDLERVQVIAGQLTAAIRRKQAEITLQRRAGQLALLNDIGKQIAAVLDLKEVFERSVHLVQQNFNYHHVAFFGLDGERGTLMMKARAGAYADFFPAEFHIKLGQGMVGWVGQEGETLLANDVSAESRYANFLPDKIPTQSELSVPIRVGQRVEGVLDAQSPRLNAFDESDVRVMEILAGQVAVAIENARLYESLRKELAERQQAEAALRESTVRFNRLITQLNDVVWSASPDGRDILDVNSAFESVYGMSADAFRSNPRLWIEMVHPDDRKIAEAGGEELFKNGQAVLEYRLVRPDGTIRWLLDRKSLLYDEQGNPTQMGGIATDITERKQMEEALREERALLAQRVATRTAELSARTADLSAANAKLARAMRAKDEFLANMSHELRTPLSGILNLAELLQMETYGALTEKQVKAVRTIYDSGQHLLGLINDILDLAKVEAGKLELQRETVVVQDVYEASLRLIHDLAFKKRQRVSAACDPFLRTINADSRRLKQILVNLLVNAVKFTPEGGEIGLKVEGDETQGAARFTVWDTGIGIVPQDQPRLFQTFSQIDNSLTRQSAGTGLGLALVRSMVELHGGSITVASEGVPGKGSAFIVSLPWAGEKLARALADAGPAAEAASSPLVSWPNGTAPLILLADDSAASVSILSDFLVGRCAGRVAVAKTGVEAVQLAWEQRPALILMDVQMPEMDGLEAIRRIRAAPELAQIPIIALTALSMPDDRERCLAAGANDYLSKPVKLAQLAQRIQELVRPGKQAPSGYR